MPQGLRTANRYQGLINIVIVFTPTTLWCAPTFIIFSPSFAFQGKIHPHLSEMPSWHSWAVARLCVLNILKGYIGKDPFLVCIQLFTLVARMCLCVCLSLCLRILEKWLVCLFAVWHQSSLSYWLVLLHLVLNLFPVGWLWQLYC